MRVNPCGSGREGWNGCHVLTLVSLASSIATIPLPLSWASISSQGVVPLCSRVRPVAVDEDDLHGDAAGQKGAGLGNAWARVASRGERRPSRRPQRVAGQRAIAACCSRSGRPPQGRNDQQEQRRDERSIGSSETADEMSERVVEGGLCDEARAE
jgi:hypothetical protein